MFVLNGFDSVRRRDDMDSGLAKERWTVWIIVKIAARAITTNGLYHNLASW